MIKKDLNASATTVELEKGIEYLISNLREIADRVEFYSYTQDTESEELRTLYEAMEKAETLQYFFKEEVEKLYHKSGLDESLSNANSINDSL